VQNFPEEDDDGGDDYTRYVSAKPLRAKDQATDALVEIVNMLEKATDPQYHQVKQIQVDWGGEFWNEDLRSNCDRGGPT